MEKKHLGASESPKSLTIFWSFPKISHPFLLFNFPLFKTHCFLPKKKNKIKGNSNRGTSVPILLPYHYWERGSHYWGSLGKSPPQKRVCCLFQRPKTFLQLRPGGCEAKRRIAVRSLWPLPPLQSYSYVPAKDKGFIGGLSRGQMRVNNNLLNTVARWWFQIFFMFIPIWGRFPI